MLDTSEQAQHRSREHIGRHWSILDITQRTVDNYSESQTTDTVESTMITDISTGVTSTMHTSAVMGASCIKPRNTKSTGSVRRKRLHRRDSDLSAVFDDTFNNSQTKDHLEKISEWGFDVFALNKASHGRALFHTVLKLFQTHDLLNKFQLDIVKLMAFASLCEEGYQSNPYHNGVHAADVAQAMHCYITQGKIQRNITPVEELVSIIAAITHDLDHPGVNQGYLIASNNELAAMYNNQAVLENHHFKMAMGALRQTGLLSHLSESLRENIEEEIKSLILATDMTRQQEFFTTLKTRIEEDSIDMQCYEDRHFVLQIALKCADISNPCRHWSACKSWSGKICDEFFRQGDYEREASLPISSMCDRFTNSMPKIQTGFIDFVVEPLFAQFERLMFPHRALSDQLSNLKANRAQWQQVVDDEQRPAVRPNSLSLHNSNSTLSDIPSDIPSPSESISDAESDSEPEEADFVDYEKLRERRHSLPVIELLARGQISRRQSVPDGQHKLTRSLTQTQKHYQNLLLDQVVGKMAKLQHKLQSSKLTRRSTISYPHRYRPSAGKYLQVS